MSKFPDFFPDDFESMLPDYVEYIRKRAYRLTLYGVNNPDSYLPTIRSDEIAKIKRVHKPAILDYYSTSCFSTYEQIKQLKATGFKKRPSAEIAVGTIEPEHGPTLTKETGHIDWWIYKDVHPETFFRKEAEDKDE